MSRSWPPSPCVEDEDTSLAREHFFGHPLDEVKSENQPAVSRGTVDQTPIILEGSQGVNRSGKDGISRDNDAKFPPAFSSDSSSSDESSGPATPPSRKSTTSITRGVTGEREKTDNLRRSPTRGRPYVSRNETDAGGDLHSMATGQRRIPSPYSYSSSTQSAQPGTVKRSTTNQFLSPSTEKLNRSISHDGRRLPDLHDRPQEPSRTTIGDTGNIEPKMRPRSLSRYRPSAPAKVTFEEDELRNTARKARKVPPPILTESSRYQDPRRGYQTPPQSPRILSESPSHSPAEDGERQRPAKHERRKSRDSPYSSSADESGHKHRTHRHSHLNEVETQSDGSPVKDRHHQPSDRSPRASHDYFKPGELDRRNQRHGQEDRKGTDSPSSARLGFGLGMEDLLERAFLDNQRKRASYQVPSKRPTPLATPTTSPPTTPRTDRLPRDYFELPVHRRSQSGRHSRQPSVDESSRDRSSPRQSTANVTQNKVSPVLTRASTTSVNTGSSGSQSRVASGQRSRRNSPVYESYASPSRETSTTPRDDYRGVQSTARVDSGSRPQSRDGKYYGSTSEFIHPPQRALSYTAAGESGHRRPTGPVRTASAVPATLSSQYPSTSHADSTSRPQSLSATSTVVGAPATVKLYLTTLPHCTRTTTASTAGGWYTIQGMSNLDFCPTCMDALGSSRYREVFVPSQPRRSTQVVKCSNSNSWIRLGWIESDREKRTDLKLVAKMASSSIQNRSCPGFKSDLRRWYHFADPRTQKPIENFDVCSACVRQLEWLYPSLEAILFERPEDKLHQERTCRLNVGSKHFPSVAEKLPKLAKYARQNDLRDKDLEAFADHLRQISRFRECARDEMLATPSWHIISDLPELTICEECYEEIVWPLANKSIAREVSKSARIVPFTRAANSVPGTSCQLYSNRMRAIFRDAVAKNDFDLLQKVARKRYDVEQKLQERKRLYERDIIAGVDRRTDIERLYAMWREYE